MAERALCSDNDIVEFLKEHLKVTAFQTGPNAITINLVLRNEVINAAYVPLPTPKVVYG